MIDPTVRPVIVVSKCLGFAACRYNAQTIRDDFVQKLAAWVEFRPVCAEVEIGLGVPRDPVRVVAVGGELRLLQPASGNDVTARMQAFARSFLKSLPEVHGFVLKSRSPSCGIKDVKVYGPGGNVLQRGSGFFGAAVLEHFPHLAVEDEGRLTNYRLREHFLTKLYTLARFSRLLAAPTMHGLVQFHAENKLLLMAYSQKELRMLGRIVANPEKQPLDQVVADYRQHLQAALAQWPRYRSHINVLMHSLGYFSRYLTGNERAYFLEQLEKYRAGRVPLSVPLTLLNAWIVRFGQEYLRQQTFFQPYPDALVEITDSGKGRSS